MVIKVFECFISEKYQPIHVKIFKILKPRLFLLVMPVDGKLGIWSCRFSSSLRLPHPSFPFLLKIVLVFEGIKIEGALSKVFFLIRVEYSSCLVIKMW